VPHPVGRGGDLLDGAARQHARRLAGDDVDAIARVVVAALEQEPVLAAIAGAGPHQVPAAAQLLAVQRERQLALRHAVARVALGLPGAAIPDHHGAAAVLALGDDALEVGVVERMVLGAHREPAIAGRQARALGHRPRQQDAVELQAEVVVHPAGGVLLDDEAVTRPRAGLAARLRRPREVSLRSVLRELLGRGGGHDGR
jgi:hypothetical protein